MLARVKVQTDNQQQYHDYDGSSTEKSRLHRNLRRCETGRVSVFGTARLHIGGTRTVRPMRSPDVNSVLVHSLTEPLMGLLFSMTGACFSE